MFGFNALLIDTIFHPEMGKVKLLEENDKKANTKKMFLYCKKKCLKLLICIYKYILPVCVKDDSGPWEKR